jgi:hypothetical protein
MKNLHIDIRVEDQINTTPLINFDGTTGICEISGESYMDNTFEFFDPIFRWLMDYAEDVSRSLKFICKLDYYNTGTSGCLYTIMETLKDFETRGGKVDIEWYYNKDDVDMEEDIQDVIHETGVKIRMITY